MQYDYFTESRSISTTVDRYGVDPLKDKSFESILAITAYNLYTVKQYDRHRVDNISNNVYGNPNLWWIIMYYNGIVSIREVVEGVTLRIPDQTKVIDILAANSSTNYGNTVKYITI